MTENPHAIVFESIVAPGGTAPKHRHGDHVGVSLTDATVEATDEQDKKRTTNVKKDTANFAGPVTHSPLHLIVVELK